METIEPYLPYLFYGIAYGGLVYTFISIFRSIFALGWSEAKGEITRAAIDEDCDSEGCTYKPLIEYKYVVYGKEYYSKRFAFGYIMSSFRFLAKMIFNKYKNHPIVTVYYNPKNPNSAVLLRGVRIFQLVNLTFFYVFLHFVEKGFENAL